VPTPVLAYLTKKLKADVGVMITASHNPPQYNGIKIFNADSLAYGEKSQGEVEKIVQSESFKMADWQHVGEARHVEESRFYVETIKRTIKLHKKWFVIVDPGCGATCDLAPVVFKILGSRVMAVNSQPDGFFPARSPEPDAESLKTLAKIVKKLGADVGIGYDGDGDRVAFIDEKGNFVDFDCALAAYASYVTKERGKGIVVTNVESSMCVEKAVEAQDGRVMRTKVGDVYVAEAMVKHNAVFGGEPCGAWIHPQFHYCPDGILSSVMLLKALEDENKSLFEFVSEIPHYQVIRENIACKNEMKYRVMKKAGEGLKAAFPRYEKCVTVDGVRLVLRNGWILVRASGTEPLVRLTVEGESIKAAKEVLNRGMAVVNKLVGEMEK
jgi:phosphoglucosamine mutase